MVLRPFSCADADELFLIRGDAQAMRYWDWPGDSSVEQTREVAELFRGEMADGSALYFTARLPAGDFVGIFDLSELYAARPDLGFMVVRKHWGKGFATEGAELLVGEARRRGITGLKARIHVGNEASRRILHKLAFTPQGAPAPFEITPGRAPLCEIFELDFHL